VHDALRSALQIGGGTRAFGLDLLARSMHSTPTSNGVSPTPLDSGATLEAQKQEEAKPQSSNDFLAGLLATKP
jgi:hypothetical protein